MKFINKKIINLLPNKLSLKKQFFVFLFLLLNFFNIVAQQNDFINFSISEGLPNLTINNILQDNIGYLWIATDKGLVKFDGYNFEVYSKEKSNTLYYKNDTLFVGLKKGLLIKTQEKELFFESKEVLKIYYINNSFYLGTKEGIYQLKKDYLKPLKLKTQIDFSIINDILLVGKNIYIASNKGLWKLNSLENTTEITKISNYKITSLLLHKKRILFSTYKNGIKNLENNTISTLIKSEEIIKKISIINDEIWVITKGSGIEIYNTKNFNYKHKITKYNTSISNHINDVYKDKQHNIWVSSQDQGIFKMNRNNAIKPLNKPTIQFENIFVNFKKIDSIHINNYNKVLKLKPNQKNISFSFKTVDINFPNKIQYRYKIGNEFSPWNSNNTINFGNQKPGKYTFIVQSRNKELIESNYKSFSFFIDIPIYKKGWFLLLSSVILLLILLSIVFAYIHKIKQKNKQKIDKLKLEKHLISLEQKALQLQMNPHFIFNVLNGIKGLGNRGNVIELNKTISQFSVLLRSVLNNSRLEEISLHDEIETLRNYLELEQKMNSKSFEYSIEKNLNNIDSEEILIPSMLLQPFIENAIKHGIQPNSINGKIKINFNIKHNFLEFTIIDNGIGFHQSKKHNNKHKSVALNITKERIKNISKNSKFLIEEIIKNNTIEGTKVWFKIPLKTDY